MRGILYEKILKEYVLLIIGTVLLAISLTSFFEPNGLVTGGVTGLAIIIADIGENFYNLNIPLWLTNIVLNIPLLIAGFMVRGKKFIARTLFATLLLSLALSFTERLPVFTSDTDMAIYTVFGSLIQGIGMGLIFRSGATTGGTDLLASIIHKYVRHISIARILLVVDSVILMTGLFVFGIRSAMYAIIANYIVSRITDSVLEGFDFAKAAFIISSKEREIAKEFMEATERGATSIKASGVYTGESKDMLMIVMSNKEIVVLKEIIKRVDPSAFIIVTDVREVLGEGFRDIA